LQFINYSPSYISIHQITRCIAHVSCTALGPLGPGRMGGRHKTGKCRNQNLHVRVPEQESSGLKVVSLGPEADDLWDPSLGVHIRASCIGCWIFWPSRHPLHRPTAPPGGRHMERSSSCFLAKPRGLRCLLRTSILGSQYFHNEMLTGAARWLPKGPESGLVLQLSVPQGSDLLVSLRCRSLFHTVCLRSPRGAVAI
jgi:hypothetical protein